MSLRKYDKINGIRHKLEQIKGLLVVIIIIETLRLAVSLAF